mmetsp:Transcript_10999/g.31058  ORF Transcript_10999/g.31058 Transcript_10999/m.31058 type:complete len:112 (+) Transcript_10999:346-681(+)
MQALSVSDGFDFTLKVAPVTDNAAKAAVLQAVTTLSASEAAEGAQLLPGAIPIRRLLRNLKIAAASERHGSDSADVPDDASSGDISGAAKRNLSLSGLKRFLDTVSPARNE